MTSPFSSISWSDSAPELGYSVEILLMHGDAAAFSSCRRRFPLGESQAVSDYLRLVSRLASSDLSLDSDSLAGALARELALDPQWARSMILGVLRDDAALGGERSAAPVALRVSRDDAFGHFLALFPDPFSGEALPYLPLAGISRSHLDDWA